MRRGPLGLLGAAGLAAWACARGPLPAAPLDPQHDACAWCRMAVSDRHFAAQVVAPAEEPRFFDDVGCLRAWLAGAPELPRGAIAYVADHRSTAWVRAGAATFSHCPGLETPMNSHLVAHADAASLEADGDASGCTVATAAEVFGAAALPGSGAEGAR
jgi:copper chaperone NosL